MAIVKEIVIKADTTDAVKDIDTLNSSIEGVDETAKDTSESISDIGKATESTSKKTKKLSTAVKGVGTALKAAGIGLIVALFAKLAEVVGKNQGAMDLFSNVMTSLEIAFKDLYGFVTENFFPAFERLKTFFANLTFDKISKAIKENLIERFNSVLEVLGFVGTAFKKLFEGDFKGALDAVKEAGKEMIDVMTGVDGTLDKVTDIVVSGVTAMTNYAKETYNAAEAMTELSNQALIAEAVNRGLIEQFDRQAEQLRQIRDDESRSIEDRIEANEELGRVLEEQELLMIRNAQLVVQAAQNEANLNNNIENQVALIEAQNEVAAIQAQIEGFRSEQLVNTNSLLREKIDLEREFFDLLSEQEQEEIAIEDARIKRQGEQNARELAEKKALEDAKLGMATKTAGNIAALTTSNTKVGKAAAAAAALINTYQGITAELATKTVTPFEFGLKLVNIAATAAIGFKSVKDILKTNPTSSAGGAGGGSFGGGGGATQSAPAFNLVSGSGTNQIAESLANQDKPLKAFVVSSDVSSSQSLDRNIVENSSL